MSMQALRLIPIWKEHAGASFKLPRRDERIIAIGASQRDCRLLKECFPAAVALSVERDAAVNVLTAKLAESGEFDHVVWLTPPETPTELAHDELIIAQQRGVLSCYRLIRALLQAGYGARQLKLTAITRQTQAVHEGDVLLPAHASVHGLVGAVAKEQVQWKVRMVDLDQHSPCPYESIFRMPAEPSADVWAYRQGGWYRRELVPYEPEDSAGPPYRDGGVYVVIGGAGGIGEVWTEHLIRAHRARVIWIGRREVNAAIQRKQEQLGRLGPTPEYICADARNLGALQAARDEIVRRHGKINGLVHAAIVLRDASLPYMTPERFESALSAKVDVSVRMMQAFGAEPLDFILFFSSLMSFGTAAGQSNYAAGCAFKDAYAQALARERPGVVKTLNWGFWGSVGVVASQAYRTRMASFGLGSIEPAEGMAALAALLGGPVQQMAYLKATQASAQQALRISTTDHLTACAGRSLEPARDIAAPSRALPLKLAQAITAASRRDLDCLLLNMLRERLNSLGLLSARNRIVAPQYELWLEESLRMVRGHETASITSDAASVWLNSAELHDLRERYRQDQQSNPALAAQLDLVDRMLQSLEDILSGRRWAVEVLFPRGSIGSMEQAYHNSPQVDYFNEVLGDALIAYLQRLTRSDASADVRILEIGAGTGTSTAPVLARLMPHREHIREYVYTDISPTFLRHGTKKYSEHCPFLTFKLFDVERPPREQSMDEGRYDVVIAANVLHATKDIRRTLRHAKALMRREGQLLLNEIVANSLIAHLTFGLTPGWWLAQDTHLRLRGGPGLTSASWQRVLGDEGFGAIEFPASQAHDTGMQIITAVSDGMVRHANLDLRQTLPGEVCA